MADSLDVHLGQERLGSIERRGPGRYRFQHAAHIVEAYGPGSVVLSASLPVQPEPFPPGKTKPFFEGLLPEGAVRQAIARSLRVSEDDGFKLLAELGRDCAGAVTVLRQGEIPRGPEEGAAEWLDGNALAALVADLPKRPLGVTPEADRVRLSLAGLQQKLVLVRSASGEFGLPLRGTPSTHILKPELGQFEDLAANEAFCLRVASCAGLEAARAEVVTVGETSCVSVERFDRARDESGRTVRVHQEDMCQALGVLPVVKYEDDGGPSVAQVVQLLRDLGGLRAAADINALVAAVVLNFLLGNSDAHAKNLALLYEPVAGVRLAPLYDIVSTAPYPDVETRLAMRIGGAEEPGDVTLAAWRRLADEAGLGSQLPGRVEALAERVQECVAATAQAASAEGWHRPVIDEIARTCRSRTEQLLQ